MASDLRHRANEIADALSEREWIDAACLFGSVARGDETPWSDIDLLVVGSRAEATKAEIVEMLPAGLRESQLSLLYRSSDELKRLSEEQGIFVDHIRREGIVLFDRTGQLTRALAGEAQPWSNVEAELRNELVRLQPYENLDRFNSNFLFCLSHLYAIGKSIVILDLAKEGVFEFNRDEAFQKFRRLRPDKTDEIDTIAQLQPFYYLVTGRRNDPLPFSYRGSKDEAAAAIKAIRTLADVGLESESDKESDKPVTS